MESTIQKLKKKANELPLKPGVYIMKNEKSEIIYIGKAKALKNRVTQYFGIGSNHSIKVKKMVQNIADFEYIVCDSEFEALILENSLIKQNQPKYNILLKDDKGYSYIKITNEKWPKIESSKTTDKFSEYIGPYNSGYIVKQTVEEARKVFKLPDCNRNFDVKTKPCLNYHIGLCFAPCFKKISHEEYLETINSAKEFIKNGAKGEASIENLTKQMEEAAENLQFETAARLRDRIVALKKIREKQKVVSITHKNQDVIATAVFDDKACVEVLIFRNYKLCDKKHFFINDICERIEIYNEFLHQYYLNSNDIPSRILLDIETQEFETLSSLLTVNSGHKVIFLNPKQGQSKQLIDMCLSNAAQNLSERTKYTTKDMAVLNDLARLLNLSKPPRYIEAYDISNTAGDNNVAGMIVFKDAKPYRKAYRRFKIKSFVGQDDYKSMNEVLDRRFSEYLKGEDEVFLKLPDLILLDGAKGQISAVLPIFKKYNINIPVFGMVKDSKHRTRAIATTGGDIDIKANQKTFNLITNIQDEVHRFAISYQKKLQTKKMLNRELTKITGIGEKKANLLLKNFGSISKIKNADIAQLSAVKGISEENAKMIFDFFKQI